MTSNLATFSGTLTSVMSGNQDLELLLRRIREQCRVKLLLRSHCSSHLIYFVRYQAKVYILPHCDNFSPPAIHQHLSEYHNQRLSPQNLIHLNCC